METIRWYDKNPLLKEVFEFIHKLDSNQRNQIAKDIIQILMNDLNLNLDNEINTIAKNYNYECKRWYDENIDLFTAFEIIKRLPQKDQAEVVRKIIETALLMYFERE